MNKKLNDDGTPNPNYNPALNEDGTPIETNEDIDSKIDLRTEKEKDSDMIKKMVEERVQAEIASTKKLLDAAYKQRDDVLAKNAVFEQEKKEATYKRLEEEGKLKEVYELKLAEATASREALEKKNTELSRDVTVRGCLNNYTFKNQAAADLAYKEIVDHLVRNEQGNWVHRSGISITEYIDAFSKSDDMSFLFKVKSSSGAGFSASKGTPPTDDSQNKSLFKMDVNEVLRLASEGKLPNQQRV